MAEEINKTGAESSGKKKGRYRQRRMLAVMLVLVFVWWFNNYTLRTASLTVYSDKVSRGFRIAVISDLHASRHGISNRRIVRRINKSSPDMVAILGDMYTSGSTEEVIQIPVDLTADIVSEGYPVYFVSGEHDYDDDYLKKIADTGAHVMNYADEVTEINGCKVHIMGIDNVYYSDTFDLRNEFSLRSDCYNILLAHIPNYEKFADFGADLTLCADTHGGMVQLPFDLGPAYSSDYGWFPQLADEGTIYDKGMFGYPGGVMFITSGIGDSPAPIRFNNRPEVAVIDVKPEN